MSNEKWYHAPFCVCVCAVCSNFNLLMGTAAAWYVAAFLQNKKFSGNFGGKLSATGILLVELSRKVSAYFWAPHDEVKWEISRKLSLGSSWKEFILKNNGFDKKKLHSIQSCKFASSIFNGAAQMFTQFSQPASFPFISNNLTPSQLQLASMVS